MPPPVPVRGKESETLLTRRDLATFLDGQVPAVTLCSSYLDLEKETPVLIQFRSGLRREHSDAAPKGLMVLPVFMSITLAELQKKCEDYATAYGFKLGRADTEASGINEVVWGGVKVLWESPMERLGSVESSESFIHTDEQLEAALSLLVIRGRRDRFLVFFDKA